MSKKEKLGKRERLRKGFTILAAIVTVACGALVAFNTTYIMSSILVGVALSVGAISAATLVGLVISRMVARNVAITKGKQESLDALKTIEREIKSPSLSKEISRQTILKNYDKYFNASLKLCKNRGFAFTGLMKEMIPTTNPNRSELIAETEFVRQQKDFKNAIGDKGSAKATKKYEKLSAKMERQNKKNGEVVMRTPAYEDKFVLPETGIEIPGINKIYATNPTVIKEFETMAKSSSIQDFGSLIKVDYKDDNFVSTLARYSDTNKTNKVKELMLEEVEYLTQKHGEENVFPIELTVEKDLGKNHRLQNKRNKSVVRFKTLEDFRNQISGMER